MITLGVKNLQEAIRFYRDGLKLPMLDSPPEVAFFNLNGTWLGLYGHDALAEDAGVAADGTGFSGVTLSHNVADKDQVAEVIGQAVKAGAILVKEPQQADWGGFHGYFQDLDGHLWEVAYNPYTWVGPDD